MRARVTRQHFVAALMGLMVVVCVGALVIAKNHGDDRVALQEDTQNDYAAQIGELTKQVKQLADEMAAASANAERAKVQANTSVDQLVKSGEQPIIAAPEVVTVPTTPNTTTTTAPPVVVIPVPPTTEPPTTTTTEPPTTTTTEPPPPTTEPPSTTTTTEPPTTTTTEPPPDETTTTTTTTTTEVAQ